MSRIKTALFAALLAVSTVAAQEPSARSTGQLLYLPVYSHIWHGDADRAGKPVKALVSVLVSVRNTDPAKPITLVSAQYYDTEGKRIKDYVSAPRIIGPMGTYELFVPRSDDTGGSGANFVIAWRSDAPVNPPIVEGVHANLPAGRAIAFITSARPIHPDKPARPD